MVEKSKNQLLSFFCDSVFALLSFFCSSVVLLPPGWSAGHYLTGSMSLSKDDAVKKAVHYPFKYVLTESASKKSGSKSSSSSSSSTKSAEANKANDGAAETDEKKKVEEEYHNAVRDLKLQVCGGLVVVDIEGACGANGDGADY